MLNISINNDIQKSSKFSVPEPNNLVPEKSSDLVPEKPIDLVPEKLNYRRSNKKSEQTLVFCAYFNDSKPVLKCLCSRPEPARLLYSSIGPNISGSDNTLIEQTAAELPEFREPI
jgi:hypothetical protein